MQDETMQMPRNARALLLPYTERCMRLGIAGHTMYGALVSECLVQLYREDGSPYAAPMMIEDCGWDNQPCYLVIHGYVETFPGRFEPGIVASHAHESRAAAVSEWERLVEDGLYDDVFEHPEYRPVAPTIEELLR